MNPDYTLSVQDTNEEALASKISAIRKGYFSDPYAEEFAPFKGNRDILMHRGYWARVHVVKNMIQNFLQTSKQLPVQIISLGAGLQTLWYNLMEDEKYTNKNLKFIELDLPIVVKRKVKKIQKSKKVQALLQKLGVHQKKQISEDHSFFQCDNKYLVHSCDLSSVQQFKAIMQRVKIDYSQPTLLYSECVLSYIEPEPVDSLLKYIHSSFRLNWFFDYEMYNPKDRFGQMMCKNFEQRGCPLVGIHAYPNLQDQRHRFENAGYKSEDIELDSMDKIYYNYIDKNQRLKIEKIEMLDELEQWNIIMGHYFGILAHSKLEAKDEDIEKQMIEVVKMKQQ